MGYGWHGWWMGWWWIFWIALIVVVLWLVFYAASRPRNGREARRTPEEILRERYARGEIDSEEYQRRLEILRHGDRVA